MFRYDTQTAGFYPNDLVLLRQVFDKLCAESRCEPDSIKAEATARRLVHLFETGRTTEAELLEGGRPCMLLAG